MVELAVAAAPPDPIRLDLGCGSNKKPGFIGVDIAEFPGVDCVADLRQGLPYEADSVAEIHSSHFFEHLEWPERVALFNDIYRVLVVGGTAQIITPDWAHACMYGDPTHKSPMSGWYPLYLNKDWRAVNAPHTAYNCDFDFTIAGSWDDWLTPRNMELKTFAMARYINSQRDLIVNLTKKAPAPCP